MMDQPTPEQLQEFQRRVGEAAHEVFGEDTSVMMKRTPEGMDIPDLVEKLKDMPEDAITDDGKFYKLMGEDASGNLNWIITLLSQAAYMSGGQVRLPLLPEGGEMPHNVGMAEVQTLTESESGYRVLEVSLVEDDDGSLEA